MSVQVKVRRDSATNVAAYTGAQGELIVDTTNNRVTVHDGSTPGGFSLAKLSDVPSLGASNLQTLASSSYGASISTGVLETLVTLAGTSTTASVSIPANAIVMAVSARTVAAVTGAPSYGVGVSGSPTQFGAALSASAGAVNLGLVTPTPFTASTPLVITATSGSFTGGTVRLAIFYTLIVPSTS